MTSFAVFLLLILLKETVAKLFFENEKYAYLVYLSATATLVGATNNIISAPIRMQNKRKTYIVANTVSPLLSYTIAIPLLLAGYYTVAMPLAGVISGITMEFTFGILNRKWFSFGLFDNKLLKELLLIGVPLLPNFLIYWVFNSSDKLMITNIMGLGAAGIYSVGSKLGHASQLIYRAFSGGWQYFAFSTMKEKDQVKSNSVIYEYLGVISYSATLFICALSYPIYCIAFPGEYLSGYIIAPYLFLAPLLQMLFQVASNQLLVIKKTWPMLPMMFGGAAFNMALNLVLIPILGIEGASIATLAGYILTNVVCIFVLVKMKLIVLSGRFLVSTAVLAALFVMWRMLWPDNAVIGLAAAVAGSGVFVFLYREDLIKLRDMVFKKRKAK